MDCPFRPGHTVCDLVQHPSQHSPRPNGGQDFGRLEGTVAALVTTVGDLRDETRKSLSDLRDETRQEFKDLREILKDHVKRIGSLEKWRTFLAGAWVVVAAVLTWVASWWPARGGH